MIKIFGKIRRQLLTKNKFGKYLIYATGEILLVVIGILIALQINNWNQDKKKRILEIALLQNIQADILVDTLDVNMNIRNYKKTLREEELLYKFMQSDLDDPVESIDYANAMGSPVYSLIQKSFYENANDLDIITNNNLKRQISRHYDYFVESVLIMVNNFHVIEMYPIKRPYFIRYFEISDTTTTLFNEGDLNDEHVYTPNFDRKALKISDLTGLKQDQGFKIILSESILYGHIKINIYEDFLDRVKNLNQSITGELELLLR